MESAITTQGWVLLAIVNIPVYFLLSLIFFKDLDDFFDSLKRLIIPHKHEWDNFFKGRKLAFWFLLCFIVVLLEAEYLI